MTGEWKIEVLAWLITLVIAALVVAPILVNDIAFPFTLYNVLFVIIGLTWARYILFWHLHPMAGSKRLKTGLIFLIPLIVFPVIEGFHTFVEYLDQIGLQTLMGDVSASTSRFLMKYIKMEYLVFAVMTFAGGFLLIIKMLRELFRQYKEEGTAGSIAK